MTASRLKHLYPEIRPWERIRLLLAAQQRQDDVEYQRLFHASAIRTWHFSEHLLAEQALHVLTLTYITEQLDAATSVFLALTQLALQTSSEQEWDQIAECSAYFFCINTEGWRAFCNDHQFPADSLVAQNQSGWVLPYCEHFLPTLAPTPDDLKHLHPEPWITASDVAQRWHQRLTDMVTSTPLDTENAA